MALQITWDHAKERINKQKHGLDFSFASLVFDDPLAVTLYDRFENAEHRWHTIGAVGGGYTILLVVHTFPDPQEEERVHVIGVRAVTPHERRRYEEGIG